ncbi:MAG: class I SAM-dependent methyltransferase [Candidatus Binataceae bacterium]
MDYDKTQMPAGYDRGRSYSPEQLALWLDTISDAIGDTPVARILDLGSGTGRYSAALARRFKARVIGVEPSAKMLTQASMKADTRVNLVRATGESLPLRSETVDMVFMSMVFHHFTDAAAVLGECRRVLGSSGFVCVRAGTTERIGQYAYVPFFPESVRLLDRTLNSAAAIKSTFAATGFELINHELVPSEAAPTWSVYADRLAYRADSILVQLSEADFRRGLASLREYSVTAPKGAVVELVDFFAFRAGCLR